MSYNPVGILPDPTVSIGGVRRVRGRGGLDLASYELAFGRGRYYCTSPFVVSKAMASAGACHAPTPATGEQGRCGGRRRERGATCTRCAPQQLVVM